MVVLRRSVFPTGPPKSRNLAELVNLRSRARFRMGLAMAQSGGFTLAEQRAFQQGVNIAKASLGKEDLSPPVRRRFETISRIRVPKVTRR